MKIELKNIKYSARLSKDSLCYSASVWVDGVRRGTVENDGRGGADLVLPFDLHRELAAHAATLPHVDVYGEMCPQDVSLMLGDMVSAHLEGKK